MADHPRLVEASVYEELKSVFRAFLDSELGAGYREQIREMQQRMDGRQSYRLIVDLHDFHVFDANVTETFVRCPLQFLAPWTGALHDWIRGLGHLPEHQRRGRLLLDHMSSSSEALKERIHLGFVGGLGKLHATPRSLRASHIGRLVTVEGIVVQCQKTHPKVVRDVHRCERSGIRTVRSFRDGSDTDLWMDHITYGQMLRGFPMLPTISSEYMRNSPPSRHAAESGAVFKDRQCITLQETPERAPYGQLPRSVTLRCCVLLVMISSTKTRAYDRLMLCWTTTLLTLSSLETEFVALEYIEHSSRVLVAFLEFWPAMSLQLL